MSNRRRPAPKSAAAKSGARTNPRARSAPRRPTPARDFWGTEPSEDREPASIRPAEDPTALIHSLGPPPLPNSIAARHYFDAVYERAAALAIALATSADLTEPADPD
jgi:hypothetical protein